MYNIKFTFNALNRMRDLPCLPRVGEIVDLYSGEGDRVILMVDLVVHSEDEDGAISWHCNCTQMKNWLNKLD